MTNDFIDDSNCALSSTLDLIGEWWTFLILREAFYGTRRFEEFQRNLGVARNILTVRLNKLCDSGIFQRVPIKEGGKRHEYKLTPMGRDLYPALIVLTQWGDRWLHTEKGAPVKFIDRTTGEEIADVSIRAQDGRALQGHEIALQAGPGATENTRERLKCLEELWQQNIKKRRS